MPHAQLWSGAFQGRSIDWSTALAEYRATTDFPACMFYAELLQANPDAKVVLSVRDAESWCAAMRIHSWSAC